MYQNRQKMAKNERAGLISDTRTGQLVSVFPFKNTSVNNVWICSWADTVYMYMELAPHSYS